MLERDLQLPIAGMVGLSLGEYAALRAARALDFTPGMALLADRARYMQEDADQVPSTLAAIVEPKLDVVSQAVEAAQAAGQGVYFANYNSPDQVVLGGAKEALEQVVEEITAKEAAKKAVVLKVSGAFHTCLLYTSLMKNGTACSIVDLYERGIATDSLSKTYSVPGLRIGWTVTNREVADRLRSVRDYTMICGGVVNDLLATYVLNHRHQVLARNRALVEQNWALYQDWLAKEDVYKRQG